MRIFLCHSIHAEWRGARCNVEVYAGEESPLEIRIPALMPDPLKFTKEGIEALLVAIAALKSN